MLWKKHKKRYTLWKSVQHVDRGQQVIYGVNPYDTIKYVRFPQFARPYYYYD